MRTLLCPLALLLACSGEGKDSSAGAADACGDIDGTGGDTGDVPNILGKWTINFGNYMYADNDCDLPGLQADDIRWLSGTMEVKGRPPDALYAIFDDDDENRFYGIENASGGVVFTGTVEKDGMVFYTSVGGLLYQVPQVDRDEIRGFGYLGVDRDGGDGVIDGCWLQGDWVAKKSGL